MQADPMTPDRLRRLRRALRHNPALPEFEGLLCLSRPLRLDGDGGEIVMQQDMRVFLRPGPARLFGTPAEPSCMAGIGPDRRFLPPLRARRIANATIMGHCAVLGPDGQIFAPDRLQSPAEIAALAASDDHGVVVQPGEDRCHCCAPSAPGNSREHVLLLHDLEPGNHGSFLIRVLPQLVAASACRLPFTAIVSTAQPETLHDALAWLGHALGLPPCPVYRLADLVGCCFASVTLVTGTEAEGLLPAAVMDPLRRALKLPGPHTETRFYVSRMLAARQRPHYRPLVNEAAAADLAVARGYRVVTPETMAFIDQIALFSGATRIVGPSGSGMLNALFSPLGCRVLDLESVQVTVRQHANLYASTGKLYSFAFGVPDAGAGSGPDRITSPWRIDPGLVAQGLDWLEG